MYKSKLQELLSNSFRFLIDEEGFNFIIENKDSHIGTLIYEKDNIRLEFHEEEMDAPYFALIVLVKKDNTTYYISDEESSYSDSYKKSNHLVEVDIFKFTNNFISREEFNKLTRELFNKTNKLFVGKQFTLEVVDLYQGLLRNCIKPIMLWAKE
jgi:hypothetical protein